MAEEKSKIKDCPFCGSNDIEIYESADDCGRNVHYVVECFNDNCDPYKRTKEEAIKFWNTRS